MEETDVCHLTPTVLSLQQAIPNSCPAKALVPSQRLTIGLQALAGTQTITSLADEFDVSRKFVYQQATTAQAALDDAFTAADSKTSACFLACFCSLAFWKAREPTLLCNCDSPQNSIP